MPREMLKLRKGDSAIMIKTDGSVELAGVNDKPLMDDKGMISPIILFAAAWAKKDQKVLQALVDNFKNCVREGYFGNDARDDFKAMEDEAEKIKQASASATATFNKTREEEKRLKARAEQGQDPRVLRQQEALKKGAKIVDQKPFEGHKVVTDPVEVAKKLNEAGYKPEDGKEKLNEILKEDPVVGSATIDEGVDNEAK